MKMSIPTLVAALDRIASAASAQQLAEASAKAISDLDFAVPAVGIWLGDEVLAEVVPEHLAELALSHLVPMEAGDGVGEVLRASREDVATDSGPGTLHRFRFGRHALSLLIPERPDGEEASMIDALLRSAGDTLSRLALAHERKELSGNLARLESIAGAASEVTALIDGEGTFSFTSASVERILGYGAQEIIGRSVIELTHPDEKLMLKSMLSQAHELEDGIDFECSFRHRDGRWIQSFSQLRNRLEDPDIASLILTIRDISDRKAFEEELAHAALHDSLTHLPNRSLFRDRVAHALARAQRHDRPVGVLLIDIDDFKRINDSQGHAAGDALLKAVAGRLLENLRSPDTAARLGSDEFALLVEDIRNVEDGTLVAERISKLLAEPFNMDGVEVRAPVSIGVAVATPREQGPDDLIRDADVAMYTAKSRGKSQIAVFEPSMHESLLEKIGLESDLRRAAQNREFVVYYQPTVRLETGAIAGMEALVRWMHPRRGLVAPGEFIPLAEETGLIVTIGRMVLEEACHQARQWQLKYPDTPMTISVNLSARQLQNTELIEEIRSVLDATGLPPQSLVLEITESVLMEDTNTVEAMLGALKDIGVRLAIDDFGTGYSSLAYLQKLPVDVLKIDRSFVSGLHAGSQELAVTKAIVELGQSLELQTVAEGIEEAEQLMHLRSMHCDLCQGFYFARPLEPADMDALLERAARGDPWADGRAAVVEA